jgi:DNA mismatch endonuclease, patch repair protein
MADVFSKRKRSEVMATIRSKGNQATEIRLMRILRKGGIKGWRRHQSLPGKPDFVFRKERLAVFVDGCFWHGCRWHCRMPKSRVAYWSRKISRNKARDTEVTRILRGSRWLVLRIWEHELKNESKVAAHVFKLRTGEV